MTDADNGMNTEDLPVFESFSSIPRMSRQCVITEKIDGTNSLVHILEDGRVLAGSRSRYISPGKGTDNFGFAKWVLEHEEELRALGAGKHWGEWWGSGIQRGYGLTNGDKRFSLFNTALWVDDNVRPKCCGVVPVLFSGPFTTEVVDITLTSLLVHGSQASPGFMNPEGVVVYHEAAKHYFKKTFENDGHKFERLRID